MSEFDGILEILKIFSFEKKRDLEVYCRNLTIRDEDFVDIILLAKTGQIEFHHAICHKDIIPEDRRLTSEDTKFAAEDHKQREKFFRKAGQLFIERRYLVGHMFYLAGFQKWHFFYFDQRDTRREENHWQHGSHIHFVNYLWPNMSGRILWDSFKGESPKINNSLHIRYQEHIFPSLKLA